MPILIYGCHLLRASTTLVLAEGDEGFGRHHSRCLVPPLDPPPSLPYVCRIADMGVCMVGGETEVEETVRRRGGTST